MPSHMPADQSATKKTSDEGGRKQPNSQMSQQQIPSHHQLLPNVTANFLQHIQQQQQQQQQQQIAAPLASSLQQNRLLDGNVLFHPDAIAALSNAVGANKSLSFSQLPALHPRPVPIHHSSSSSSAAAVSMSSGGGQTSGSNDVMNSLGSFHHQSQLQHKRKSINDYIGHRGSQDFTTEDGGAGSPSCSSDDGSSPKAAKKTMNNLDLMFPFASSSSLLQYGNLGGGSGTKGHNPHHTAAIQGISDLGPPKEKDKEELAKMTPAERRRYERNLREQQRSYRISQQIKQLRDVLAESNIPFKPNKFSILVSVAEYIKQLQTRAIMLDAEHQKLSDTITQTHQAIASGQLPSSGDDSDDKGDGVSTYSDEHELVMVQGINYAAIFKNCPFALGVSALDGRILSNNNALATLFGCRERDMNQQSLFLFIRNHQDVFEAMADLLKRSSLANGTTDDDGGAKEAHLLYWCGHVISQNHRKLHFNITLTSTAESSPKYFNFSAAPVM